MEANIHCRLRMSSYVKPQLVLHRYHFLPILPIPILHLSILADTDTGDPWAVNKIVSTKNKEFFSAGSTIKFVNGTNQVESVPNTPLTTGISCNIKLARDIRATCHMHTH